MLPDLGRKRSSLRLRPRRGWPREFHRPGFPHFLRNLVDIAHQIAESTRLGPTRFSPATASAGQSIGSPTRPDGPRLAGRGDPRCPPAHGDTGAAKSEDPKTEMRGQPGPASALRRARCAGLAPRPRHPLHGLRSQPHRLLLVGCRRGGPDLPQLQNGARSRRSASASWRRLAGRCVVACVRTVSTSA